MFSTFRDNFNQYLTMLPHHSAIVDLLTNHIIGKRSSGNVLLAGAPGFPIDCLWEEAVRRIYCNSLDNNDSNNKKQLHTRQYISERGLPYFESPYFIYIDLTHPDIKDTESLVDFVKTLILSKCIEADRHLVIIHEVHRVCCRGTLEAFKVMVERFSSNVCFVCTSHHPTAIDTSLMSRFLYLRVPLATEDEVVAVVDRINSIKTTKTKNNSESYGRNLTRILLSKGFANEYNYPAMQQRFAINMSLIDVRKLAYQLCQYNLTISEVAQDLLRELRRRRRDIHEFIAKAASIDVMLAKRGGREPLYMELLILEATNSKTVSL